MRTSGSGSVLQRRLGPSGSSASHSHSPRSSPSSPWKADPELLFTAPDGGPIRKTWRRRFFWPAATAAGPGRLRIHALRHMAVSLPIDESVHRAQIAACLGHEDVRVTLSVYGHLFDSHDDRTTDAMDRALARRAESGDYRRVAALESAALTCGCRVEVRGFEPLTPAVRRQCSTGLSYTPESTQGSSRQPSPSTVRPCRSSASRSSRCPIAVVTSPRVFSMRLRATSVVRRRLPVMASG